jgi:ankyrin repeat protein
MAASDRFFQAITDGDAATVASLLATHPELARERSPQGVSPVLLAAYYGQPEIAAMLAQKSGDLDVFEAAATGDAARVRALLSGDGSLANAVATDGFGPLGLASFFGHADAALALLEHGATVNAASQNGQRVMPLHSAVAGGHFAVASALVERGADVNAVQADDFTPLHGAAQNGQPEMVRLLLDRGADRNARTGDGRTPRDMALEAGHSDVAAMLEA